MSRRLPPVLFIVVLILATLACNIPGGSVPSVHLLPHRQNHHRYHRHCHLPMYHQVLQVAELVTIRYIP